MSIELFLKGDVSMKKTVIFLIVSFLVISVFSLNLEEIEKNKEFYIQNKEFHNIFYINNTETHFVYIPNDNPLELLGVLLIKTNSSIDLKIQSQIRFRINNSSHYIYTEPYLYKNTMIYHLEQPLTFMNISGIQIVLLYQKTEEIYDKTENNYSIYFKSEAFSIEYKID